MGGGCEKGLGTPTAFLWVRTAPSRVSFSIPRAPHAYAGPLKVKSRLYPPAFFSLLLQCRR